MTYINHDTLIVERCDKCAAEVAQAGSSPSPRALDGLEEPPNWLWPKWVMET